MKIFIIVVLLLILGGVVVTFLLSGVLYTVLLVRTGKNKWARRCSMPSDPEQVDIYDRGWKWHETYGDCAKPVEIRNDGLKLVGEYYDFGCDRAVIIAVGRTETLLYSYYYAEPYRALGFNVLVYDNRAHGLSEGILCRVGVKECGDILAWARLLHDEYGNKRIHLHGLCIGSASCLYALTRDDCPDYVETMVADGMFATFGDSYRLHITGRGHSLFPIYYESLVYIRLISRINITGDGPLYRIGKLKKPILFIHSRQDQFSAPEKLTEIYEACNAPKTLEWFEKGGHSRVRINNTAKYDFTIANFIKEKYT